MVLSTGDEDATIPLYVGWNYAAFPALAKASGGDLVVLHTRDNNHNGTSQSIQQRRSTDGGASWGTLPDDEVEFIDTPGEIDGNPAMAKLASGRLVASYWVGNDAFFRYSDDDGSTWSTPVDVGDHGYTQYVSNGGPIVELGDGTLLYPAYAKNTADTGYDAILLESDDDGATWSLRSVIATASGVPYEEPHIGILDNGVMLALVRVDTDRTIRKVYSSDNGATWGSITTAFSGYGWPAWVQLTSGVIIAFSRHWPGSAPSDLHDPAHYGFYRVSHDRGASWEAAHPINASLVWAYEYAAVIEVSTNVAGVVHALGHPDDIQRTRLEYLELSV